MRSWLRIIIDSIFPPTKHGALLAPLTPEQFVRHYSTLPVRDVITLSRYHAPVIQAAIAACKFEKNLQAAKLLATLLATWLTEHPTPGTTILIPLPLSRARQKERGFNQVERVLRYLPNDTSHRIETHWLLRSRDTVRQTSLGRTARLKNMAHAFTTPHTLSLVEWSDISRVIICDDVLTTGATLTAAREALLQHIPKHIELVCIAWAH